MRSYYDPVWVSSPLLSPPLPGWRRGDQDKLILAVLGFSWRVCRALLPGVNILSWLAPAIISLTFPRCLPSPLSSCLCGVSRRRPGRGWPALGDTFSGDSAVPSVPELTLFLYTGHLQTDNMVTNTISSLSLLYYLSSGRRSTEAGQLAQQDRGEAGRREDPETREHCGRLPGSVQSQRSPGWVWQEREASYDRQGAGRWCWSRDQGIRY